MNKLRALGMLGKLTQNKTKTDVFRVLSISTVMILITTLLEPAPVDMVYILLIESLCLVGIMLLSYFFLMNLVTMLVAFVASVILVPLLLLFLWVALMMITMMLGFDSLTNETASTYPLINYSLAMLDGDATSAINSMIAYFGTDLYWIVGSIFVHHFIFDVFLFYKKRRVLKSEQVKEDQSMDIYAHFTFKAMVQASVIMLFGLVMALPISIIMMFFAAQMWAAYLIVILLRMALEWFGGEMGEGSVKRSGPKNKFFAMDKKKD